MFVPGFTSMGRQIGIWTAVGLLGSTLICMSIYKISSMISSPLVESRHLLQLSYQISNTPEICYILDDIKLNSFNLNAAQLLANKSTLSYAEATIVVKYCVSEKISTICSIHIQVSNANDGFAGMPTILPSLR